jgi:valyl-tRNA synthetase
MGLKMLHPLMPFITEELYHRLPGAETKGAGDRHTCGSIMVAAYPAPAVTQRFQSASLDGTMALLQSIAHSARSTRASLGLTKQRLTMYIRCANEELFQQVKNNAKDITVMSNAQETHALHRSEEQTYGNPTHSPFSPLSVFI